MINNDHITIVLPRHRKLIFLLLLISISNALLASPILVGVARKSITPSDPIYLTGYAGREKPATGVVHDLWAKAVVIQESATQKIIIVSTDILGLSHEISEAVSKAVMLKHKCSRSQLLFNSSHTHSGPMIWPSLSVIADYTPEQQQVVSSYAQKLTNDIIAVIDTAFASMEIMEMSYGTDSAAFAKNRRLPTPKGIINSLNINGPTDHNVPVLKITNSKDEIRVILFGYACHNTTVVGDNYLVNGDYAGFAQIELEKKYPGSTAMFIMGFAGDQNPYPRGTIELAMQHGKSLTDAVVRVLNRKMATIDPSLNSASVSIDLPFKPVDVDVYKKDIIGTNKFLQRRAKLILEGYNKGWKMTSYPYFIQAIKLSKGLTLLSLAGEVVVDYALKTKKMYPNEQFIFSGYSNEVMCYIPSKRVLQEGGYEAVDNMIYYGMPGPFDESIEDRIVGAIKTVMSRLVKK